MSIKNSHCFILSQISDVFQEELESKSAIHYPALNNAK